MLTVVELWEFFSLCFVVVSERSMVRVYVLYSREKKHEVKTNYFHFIKSLQILRFALAALSDFCGSAVQVLKISLGHKTRRL